MTETIRNFIDGELVDSATTELIDLVDLDVGGGAGAHLPHADLDPGHRGQRT